MKIKSNAFVISIKVMIIVLTLVLIFGVSLNVSAVAVSGDHSYVERSENGIKINGGTYRVEETLKKEDLYFGVKYYNDSIFVSTTLQERMTEYALGGSTYGTVPFVMGQEYSGSAHVVEIPIDTGVEIIPWQVVRNGVWQLSNIITIAKDFESHYPEYKVIAAINGSFFDISNDENYGHTSYGAISAFGENYLLRDDIDQVSFPNDGSVQSIIDTNALDKSARPVISVYDENGVEILKKVVGFTNCEPDEGGISVYYGIFDSSHKCQDIDVKNGYIVDGSDAYTVAYDENTYYGKGVITKIGDATLKTNQFAIVSRDSELTDKLGVGVTVRVQYESANIDNSGKNTIYYVDKIVNNGEEQDQVQDAGVLSAYSQYRYPRTILGRREDGTIVMTVTDGRQASKGYYGLNGTESAAQMLYYGCSEAYVFDGGGSTSMAIMENGELTYVNSASDGSPRADGNAMLVVVKVPTLEIETKAKQDSIDFSVNVVKSVEKYSDLYVGVDGKYEKIKSGEKVSISGLDTYTKYNYGIYAKIGDNYLSLPYSGIINTAKHLVEFKGISVRLDGDNYKVSYSLTDIDSAVTSFAIRINGKTFRAKNGIIAIDKEYGSPLWEEAEVVITYELEDVMGKKNPQSMEIRNYGAKLYDASTIFDSIVSELGSYVNNLIN